MGAFALDNWNEERKELKELNQYIYKIAGNIREDINLAKDQKQKRDSLKFHNRKAINAYLTGDFDVVTFIKAERFFYEFYFIFNKSGYEALKSSGYLAKIENEKIDSLLNQYYVREDRIREIEESFNNFIEKMEAQFRVIMPAVRYRNLIYPNSNMPDSVYMASMNQQELLIDYFKTSPFEAAVLRSSLQGTLIYEKLISTGEAFIEETEKLKASE